MAKKILLIGLLWAAPLLVGAEVTQLVFITPPRTAAPSTLSEILTVQTQDASGSAAPINETADLTFISTSATGEFLNESGQPVSKVMSKGTSRRNFYYRDQTIGAFTLTVTVTERTSKRSWQASQEIQIGENLPPPPAGGGGEEEPAEEKIVKSSRLKATFSERKRIVSVMSPVIFRAESSGGSAGEPRLVWVFGDGGAIEGRQVEHTYKFPGDYIVVLNAYSGDERVSIRGNVKVFRPEVEIIEQRGSTLEDGYIRLANRSAYELNLGNLRLTAGRGWFVFPPDTIFPAKSEISFPASITGFIPQTAAGVSLIYPGTQTVLAAKSAPENAIARLAVTDEVLNKLQTTALRLAASVNKLQLEKRSSKAEPAAASPDGSVGASIELEKPGGLFSRGLSFIKNILAAND